MRLLPAFLGLILTVFTTVLTALPVSYESTFCRLGLCRFDQVVSSIDAQGLNDQNIQVALSLNPGNPSLWATYGELLSVQGGAAEAASIFEHAIALGPNMPPVLMRAANFDFTHNRIDHGLRLAHRILLQTGAFDQVLFSYFTSARLPLSQVLGRAVPTDGRAAKAWISWLGSVGTTRDMLQTWTWMQQNKLTDETSMDGLTKALWDRRDYVDARKVWVDWLGAGARGYLKPELVWDPEFKLSPSKTPFDWVIDSSSSAQIRRGNGLEIRFSGADNLRFAHLRQSVPVRPGRYRLTLDVEASGLTTDRHPEFHVSSVAGSGTRDLAVQAIGNTEGRTHLGSDFTVPPGADLIQIQLERQPSERFDNKLKGTIRIYGVFLIAI